MEDVLHVLGAEGAEAVGEAGAAVSILFDAPGGLVGPARAVGVLVGGAAAADVVVAVQELPAGEQRLHPPDPLEVEAQVLDQVLDHGDPAQVLVGVEEYRRCPEGVYAARRRPSCSYLRMVEMERPARSANTPMEITGSSSRRSAASRSSVLIAAPYPEANPSAPPQGAIRPSASARRS